MANFPFHGEPGELLELSDECARAHSLHVAVERFFPTYTAADATDEGVASTAERLGGASRVGFGKRPLKLDARTAHGLVGANPDCLFLSLGEHTTDGLRESAFATSAPGEHRAFWDRLVRDIREGMHVGAVVLNPLTGEAGEASRHRHTPGAHALASNGVPMLAAAGWNRFEFTGCRGD